MTLQTMSNVATSNGSAVRQRPAGEMNTGNAHNEVNHGSPGCAASPQARLQRANHVAVSWNTSVLVFGGSTPIRAEASVPVATNDVGCYRLWHALCSPP